MLAVSILNKSLTLICIDNEFYLNTNMYSIKSAMISIHSVNASSGIHLTL